VVPVKKQSSKTNAGKIEIADAVEIHGDNATAQKIIKGLTSASSQVVRACRQSKIKDSDIIVDKIFTISRLGAPIIRLEVVDGVLFASAINGPSSVKKYLNFNGRLDKLKENVVEINQKMYKQYAEAQGRELMMNKNFKPLCVTEKTKCLKLFKTTPSR
jgi:hypothetical protein